MRTLPIRWYDNKIYDIPIPKSSFWFRKNDSRGLLHCVVSCFNQADVFYITDNGTAHMAYCEAHAKVRIFESLLGGRFDRGLWCEINHGRLKPHWYYSRYITYLDADDPKRAKKLDDRIRMWTANLDKIRGHK